MQRKVSLVHLSRPHVTNCSGGRFDQQLSAGVWMADYGTELPWIRSKKPPPYEIKAICSNLPTEPLGEFVAPPPISVHNWRGDWLFR